MVKERKWKKDFFQNVWRRKKKSATESHTFLFIAYHQCSLLLSYSILHFEWQGEEYTAGTSIWWRERYIYNHRESETEKVLSSSKTHTHKSGWGGGEGREAAAVSVVTLQGGRSNLFLSLDSLTGELITGYQAPFPSSQTSLSAEHCAIMNDKERQTREKWECQNTKTACSDLGLQVTFWFIVLSHFYATGISQVCVCLMYAVSFFILSGFPCFCSSPFDSCFSSYFSVPTPFA